MKLLFFSIYLIISIQCIGQNRNITGEFIYSKELLLNPFVKIKDDYQLSFDKSISFFERLEKNPDDIQKTVSSDNGITQKFTVTKRKDWCLNTKTGFYFLQFISNHSFVVKENDFNWNWKIEDETKKIGGYNCKKATTRFRGWNYVAWFAPEIPVSYGPWKFHGLPGLILEVYDVEKKALHSVVKKIEFKDSIEVSPDNLPLDKTINIADYLKKEKQNSMELRKKHLSRLPKGSISVNLDECEQCPKFKRLEYFEDQKD